MKDISKAHTINTHIQQLGHKRPYRPDDTLRLFNGSAGCGEWKRTPAIAGCKVSNDATFPSFISVAQSSLWRA
jgi:hypothetical protein